MAEELIADAVPNDDAVLDDAVLDDAVLDTESAVENTAPAPCLESEVTAASVEDGVAQPGPESHDGPDRPAVYGDNAYGTGPFHERLEEAGIDSRCKTQDPCAKGELFTKDRFDVDLSKDTVTCPAGVSVAITRHRRGGGLAEFKDACATCALRAECTNSRAGRTIAINAHEEALARARARQRDPRWLEDYRGTRPKVERKNAHLMRRKHGGRNARVRGTKRVDDDFRLLAAAANLARLAVLGVCSQGATWVAAGA